MQRIAIGAAMLAVAIALIAVVVVVVRHDEPAAEAATDKPKPTAAPATRKVAATDVVKLKAEVVETAGEGIRVTDEPLRKALGLAAGDTIVAISGYPLHATYELRTMMLDLSLLRPRALFVDLIRDKQPVLERWELDGDLGTARHASFLGSGGTPFTPPSLPSTGTPADPDAIAASIQKINDTTYVIPHSAVDAILSNPMGVAKSARVVPAMKNGQPEGFKLYAIKPNSVYAALGFTNGDTLRAINGYDLTTPDKAMELYTKLRDIKQLTVDITRHGQPMMLNYMIK